MSEYLKIQISKRQNLTRQRQKYQCPKEKRRPHCRSANVRSPLRGHWSCGIGGRRVVNHARGGKGGRILDKLRLISAHFRHSGLFEFPRLAPIKYRLLGRALVCRIPGLTRQKVFGVATRVWSARPSGEGVGSRLCFPVNFAKIIPILISKQASMYFTRPQTYFFVQEYRMHTKNGVDVIEERLNADIRRAWDGRELVRRKETWSGDSGDTLFLHFRYLTISRWHFRERYLTIS
jgi:hypothetical protein